MKLIIAAATELEWKPLKTKLDRLPAENRKQSDISFATTGVGMVPATYAIMQLIEREKPDLMVQIGIAGSFDSSLEPGKVIVVKEEIFGDVGVEESNDWKDVFDMQFEKADAYPFSDKKLKNPHLDKFNLVISRAVSAISVNEITTRPERIETLKQKYSCGIESMEGAAFHYVCLQKQVPFLQIRAISNYVGERDKSKWNIKEALENLAETVVRIINNLAAENK